MLELRQQMKAIIYCRVSTQEQARSGYSLDAQDRACRLFAENAGYIVDRVFREEGESAKTINRTELYRLTKYIETHRIQALIIWKLDRLARNITDQGNLIRNFARAGIRVLSATESNEESATGNLTRNIAGVFAQFENELKAERAIMGMKAALKDGRWLWRAPIGYKREIADNGRTVITPGAQAPLIAQAFRMALDGYTKADIARHLKDAGIRAMTPKLAGRILENPIYCGIIRVPWFPDDIQGSHTPIIGREHWERAQLILAGRIKATGRLRDNPEFPLRRFVRCDLCGAPMTAALCRGRHGGKYPYYFCRSGCGVTVRKADLEHQFAEFLESFKVDSGILKMFLRLIREKWIEKQKGAHAERQQLAQELQRLKAKRDRTNDLMLAGVFDEDTYRSIMPALKMEISLKQAQLHEAQADAYDIDAALAFCRHFISNVAAIWRNARPRGKVGVQNALFPEGVRFSKKTGFKTPTISLILKAVAPATASKMSLGVPKVLDFKPLFSEAMTFYNLKQDLAA